MKITKALKIASVAAAITVSSFSAQAESKAPGSGPNPFTDCGIGAALFSNTGWAAAISNVIWDIGTTAVISATASPETCNAKNVAAAKFITETYATVVEEAAKGEGQHLTALYEIYSCDQVAHDAITASIRGNVGEMVTAESYTELDNLQKSESLYNIVNTAVSTEFAQSCSA